MGKAEAIWMRRRRVEASNVLPVDLCKRGAVVVLLPAAGIFAHQMGILRPWGTRSPSPDLVSTRTHTTHAIRQFDNEIDMFHR